MFLVGTICWILGWILLRRTFRVDVPDGPGCGGVLPLPASHS